jgi:hypothetical protein
VPPLGEPLAEMVREVEVRDHVELDDLPQPLMRERDERARIASPGIGYDKADVEVVGRPPDRAEDPVAAEVECHDARLNLVARRELGCDLPEALLAPRHQDDVDAARRHLARELLPDARGSPGDERPGTVRVLVDLLHGTIFLDGTVQQDPTRKLDGLVQSWAAIDETRAGTRR